MAQGPEVEDRAEWVTVAEAGRRLGMSASSFTNLAKFDGITVERRGSSPGVPWEEVEAFIEGARVSRGSRLRAAALMHEVCSRLGWSDQDWANAPRVSWLWLSRWRGEGIPGRHLEPLERLLPAEPADVTS